MEEKGAGAAGRIEHMLDKRPIDDVLDHLRGKPIRCVIFAESMPFVAVDQRFIKDLENVGLDLGEPEAPHMRHDPAHQRFTFPVGYDPIEEIAFDRARDSRRLKSFSGEEAFRIVFWQAHDGERNALRDDDKEGVLEPKRVALDFAAIDQFQELRPELPLEHHCAILAQALP